MLFQKRSPTVAIPEANQQGPEYPEKITLIWVRDHVPLTWWFWATGVLFATFLIGVEAARLQFVQELAWQARPINIAKDITNQKAACSVPQKLVSDKQILRDAESLEAELKRASESARLANIENCLGNAYNAASSIQTALNIATVIKTEIGTNVSSEK